MQVFPNFFKAGVPTSTRSTARAGRLEPRPLDPESSAPGHLVSQLKFGQQKEPNRLNTNTHKKITYKISPLNCKQETHPL